MVRFIPYLEEYGNVRVEKAKYHGHAAGIVKSARNDGGLREGDAIARCGVIGRARIGAPVVPAGKRVYIP